MIPYVTIIDKEKFCAYNYKNIKIFAIHKKPLT